MNLQTECVTPKHGRAWLLAAVLPACLLQISCTNAPTGSAAQLYQTRPDTAAQTLTQGPNPTAQVHASDLDDFERETASIPDAPIHTDEKALDDLAVFISTQYGATKTIVEAHQRVLEDFKDVGSFLTANFTKSPDEIRKAIADFDSLHPDTPIGPKIFRFQSSEQAIFEKNREISKAMAKVASQSLNPVDWVSGLSIGPEVAADEVMMLPSRLMAAVFCPAGHDCQPVSSGKITLCTNGNCISRTMAEQRALIGDALSRAQAQKQAVTNANAYIQYIEDKLALIQSLDTQS